MRHWCSCDYVAHCVWADVCVYNAVWYVQNVVVQYKLSVVARDGISCVDRSDCVV